MSLSGPQPSPAAANERPQTVTRARPARPPNAELRARLEQLRAWQRLLDDAFRVPGTRIRFGWDPVIGLIPWAGDVVAALLGAVLIYHGHRMRLPGVVQLRLVLNVVIDLVLGAVPFVGDVVDMFWKSTTRNLALLERHAVDEQPATWRDWAFVLSIAALVVAIAALPLLVIVWVVGLLGGGA